MAAIFARIGLKISLDCAIRQRNIQSFNLAELADALGEDWQRYVNGLM